MAANNSERSGLENNKIFLEKTILRKYFGVQYSEERREKNGNGGKEQIGGFKYI